MLNIMITCGAGFSSSALVTQLNKDAQEKNLDVKFEYMPFDFGGLRSESGTIEGVEIVMLCPHLQHESKNWQKDIRMFRFMSFRPVCTV